MTAAAPPDQAHAAATAIAAKHGNAPDALIEILHELQEDLSFVPEAAVAPLAKALNLSRAEVHGVISFYHDFRREPAGRHVIKICAAEACQSMQGRELLAAAEKALKIRAGETTSDGKVTLEKVYCLGLCACSPAMLVDNRPVARVDAKAFKSIVAELG